MLSINQHTVLGRAGRDAEVFETRNGAKIVTIAVATDYKRKDTDEKVTTWHKVKVFGYQADYAATVKKGNTVFAQGRSEADEWEDKDGNKRVTTVLVAFSFAIIKEAERKPGGGGGGDGIPF